MNPVVTNSRAVYICASCYLKVQVHTQKLYTTHFVMINRYTVDLFFMVANFRGMSFFSPFYLDIILCFICLIHKVLFFFKIICS